MILGLHFLYVLGIGSIPTSPVLCLSFVQARVLFANVRCYGGVTVEAIEIRRRSPGTMNKDEGAYMLHVSHLEQHPGGVTHLSNMTCRLHNIS